MQNYLTVAQFASKLGVHRFTIYVHLKNGDIKAHQLTAGGQWLIKAKELEKWTARKVNVRMRLEKIKKNV